MNKRDVPLAHELPSGYRWATPEEVEDPPEGAVLVRLTHDSSGYPYVDGEADLAVPMTKREVELMARRYIGLDEAVSVLEAWVRSLPEGHWDKPGALRSVVILKQERDRTPLPESLKGRE